MSAQSSVILSSETVLGARKGCTVLFPTDSNAIILFLCTQNYTAMQNTHCSLQHAQYTLHGTLHASHCMLHTVCFTWHTTYCTLHTANYILDTKHCTVKLVTDLQAVDTKTLCSLDCPLHTEPLSVSFVQCAVCSVLCAMCSVYCVVCSVQCVLCSVLCAVCN